MSESPSASAKVMTAERSIIKKYRPDIWRKFVDAIDEFDMVKDGDKIAVCISGGKDSMLMDKCFQELERRSPVKFGLEFLVMDPGYNAPNLALIKQNAADLQIPIKIFESGIFDIVFDIQQSPCYRCARMRRGALYAAAQAAGCNKIALGHHFDDVVETVLLSMIYGAEFKTMMPRLKSKNFENMELIRPMYYIRERHIIAWSRYNGLNFLQCACRFTEEQAADRPSPGGHKRLEMKHLVKQLESVYPNAPQNIYKSTHNVILDALISYYKKEQKHHFLDDY